MGRAYKIRCRHCGAQFDHYGDSTYGVMQRCVGCGEADAEPSAAINCPSCKRRVNSSAAEFEQQIVEEITWE